MAIIKAQKHFDIKSSVSTGDVYRVYRDMCEIAGIHVSSLAAVSQRIKKLNMIGVITANCMSKGRGGMTREISINGDIDALESAIYRDVKLARYARYIPNQKKLCSHKLW